jgi:arabinan endo-1,5-alpha-L-arabinosidase
MKMKRKFLYSLIVLLASIGCIPALCAAENPKVIAVTGDTEYVHDPSIIKDGGTWYEFGTANGPNRDGELPIRCSNDLHQWEKCGVVFKSIPEWIKKESPQTKELWAPDISYFNGEYHLYYAFSVFGKNTSGIALLTNKTLDPRSPAYKWQHQGLVLLSRAEDNFNAIDPCAGRRRWRVAGIWQFLGWNQDAATECEDWETFNFRHQALFSRPSQATSESPAESTRPAWKLAGD